MERTISTSGARTILRSRVLASPKPPSDTPTKAYLHLHLHRHRHLHCLASLYPESCVRDEASRSSSSRAFSTHISCSTRFSPMPTKPFPNYKYSPPTRRARPVLSFTHNRSNPTSSLPDLLKPNFPKFPKPKPNPSKMAHQPGYFCVVMRHQPGYFCTVMRK